MAPTAARNHQRSRSLLTLAAAAALALLAPNGARAQSDICSRGFMSGVRAYRDANAQAACRTPCVAVSWLAPVGEMNCITGYEVTLEDPSDPAAPRVTRSVRASSSRAEGGVVLSGHDVKAIHEYKVTVTTKYSPRGTEKTSFLALSSSA